MNPNWTGTTSVRWLDRTAFEITEGVAVDKSGNVYVSFPALGEIRRFAPGSSDGELFATVPDWDLAPEDYFTDHFGILGLALDADGHVYAAVESAGSAGVWKFDCRTGEGTRFEGTETMLFANAFAFDDSGNLFVTEPVKSPRSLVGRTPDSTARPASFGIGATESTMYAVNLANGSFEPNELPGPALVAIDVDTPGMPLP